MDLTTEIFHQNSFVKPIFDRNLVSKTGFSSIFLKIFWFLTVKKSGFKKNSTPVWETCTGWGLPPGFPICVNFGPELYDSPCTNVYNTGGNPVGHFDTFLDFLGLGDPLDAGKHALQLLSATFCLFSRGSDNLMPITDRY